MKKLIYTTAMICATAIFAMAQAPEMFNYQGVARDNGGNVLSNQSIGLQLSIHEGSPTGTVVYQETHSPTTSDLGLFNVMIGDGSVVSGTFSTIDWSGNSHYVQVELDPNGGTSYTDMGTSQLVSVPYALSAGSAENVLWEESSGDVYYENGQVGIGTSSPAGGIHLLLDGTNITDGLRIESSQGTNEDWYFYMPVNDNFILRDDGVDMMTFENTSGNVGIGIDNPSNTLSADGGADFAGNVGIGTTSPTTDLYIKQNTTSSSGAGITIERNADTDDWQLFHAGTDNLWFQRNGSLVAWIAPDGSLNTPSDKRLKTDIAPMGEVLDGVMKLKPSTYNYTHIEQQDQKSMGFIAQEVREVFPEVVREDEQADYVVLNYDNFGVIAIKAIQEQQEQIEELKKEIARLKE